MPTTIETLRRALEVFRVPSSGPQPKDIYKAQHWEMAGAHAFLVNALLSVYEQAPSVPEEKTIDFVGYALQWVAAMHHHHEWEETIYYPLFNPKFDTSFIVAEHESFSSDVNNFEDYLVSCLPAGTKYGFGKMAETREQIEFDGDRTRSLIDAFAGPLVTHLMQEITYLEPEKIKASGLTEEEVKHIASVSDKHMLSMPITTFLTYVVMLTPKSSGFPPAPGFVKSLLVPYAFYWPNRRVMISCFFAPKK
ncbi:hypothetical protein NLI96_g9818 [Meripilus lineatus]|uniref:Hemerythrin-like domain-containing protein n=1 Tax=Meripilus lineatus TaxID=2056292 RepID=A0AAD5YAM3_9APHY|nr:hypothetical protein NLI96_g9818 [Physisporinus lineatus]